MDVARTVEELRAARQALPGSVGFVPTMGALHRGHMSLVEAARAQCASVVASVFVNPTQFGPNEDLARYPRPELQDLAMLEAGGVALAFLPSVEVMYPEGSATSVRVGGIAERLEGASRPGHFDGVATVVTKLFNLVQPDRAYFGRKDAQQLAVIRQMVRDLDQPVEIVGCPTVRDEDGLALSSRNVYLSPEERTQALSLSRGLRRAAAVFADGIRDAGSLRQFVEDEIRAQPLAQVDYVAIADAVTLEELTGPLLRPALLAVAVRFGTTRLIDNVSLGD
ncbi:MAG: pantoate--beta-alanine ligase [Dehalococcoidia bacterium]|nr:pantoate--beta-alanine ligase [Dehalococcoidia bacterium]